MKRVAMRFCVMFEHVLRLKAQEIIFRIYKCREVSHNYVQAHEKKKIKHELNVIESKALEKHINWHILFETIISIFHFILFVARRTFYVQQKNHLILGKIPAKGTPKMYVLLSVCF